MDAHTGMMNAVDAFALIGVGRTKAYEILNSGVVPTLRLGRAIMVRADDWQHYVDNLPAYRGQHTRKAA